MSKHEVNFDTSNRKFTISNEYKMDDTLLKIHESLEDEKIGTEGIHLIDFTLKDLKYVRRLILADDIDMYLMYKSRGEDSELKGVKFQDVSANTVNVDLEINLSVLLISIESALENIVKMDLEDYPVLLTYADATYIRRLLILDEVGQELVFDNLRETVEKLREIE